MITKSPRIHAPLYKFNTPSFRRQTTPPTPKREQKVSRNTRVTPKKGPTTQAENPLGSARQIGLDARTGPQCYTRRPHKGFLSLSLSFSLYTFSSRIHTRAVRACARALDKTMSSRFFCTRAYCFIATPCTWLSRDFCRTCRRVL